jgi:hypothetical protein
VGKYEYHRIESLNRELSRANLAPEIVEQIMDGGDAIMRGTHPKKKAAWLGDAMRRMDALLDPQTRRTVREGCACCLGGKRLEISKSIARNYDTLEARIAAANEARSVFGHSVAMTDEGKVRVSFFPEGATNLRCPCLGKVDEPLPITYCQCGGGHVKHHLQIALGRKLECTVESSVLSSGGKQGCTFLFDLL